MISKTKTMKKKSKHTLTPKLRFAEFRDGEGWQTPQLSDLYDFKRTNTLSRDKLNYEAGTIRNIHYGDIHTKFKPLFRVDHEHVPFINPEVSVDAFEEENDCEEGDIVLADASEDLNDVGKAIEVVSLDGQRVVAGTHTILATRHGSVPILGFGGHLFQSAAVRAGIQRESQGAKVYGISANRISPIALPLPPTNQEQQKIADCLSSLDGLIAADGRMLDALKTHKKGLMQQIFPQPGQTQPRLRFPEFRDKGEWGKSLLGKLLSRKPEYGVNAAAVPFSEDLPIYIRITDIDDEGQFAQDNRVSVNIEATEENYLVEGDIVLARTGASVGKSYRYRQNDGRLVFAGFLIRVRPNPKKLVPDFLSNYLTTWQYWDWVRVNSARSGQPGINGSEYASMPVPSPPAGPKGNELAEQQKIADCLTSLDTRIAAQATKIDALRTHKRGLMQQLFPAPEEQ